MKTITWTGNGVLGAVLLGFALFAGDLAAAPLRVVVLGDSILWGQGLLDGDKMHTRVVGMLQDCLGYGPVEVIHRAHSGAIIGVGDTNRNLIPLHGEIPTKYPTVLQQCADFTNSPQTVDLVLLDGGANDVNSPDGSPHGLDILDPLVPINEISNRATQHCRFSMSNLLFDVSAKFTKTNVTIVVSGYFPIVSAETIAALPADMVEFLSSLLGNPIGPISQPQRDEMVAKSQLWAQKSAEQFRLAVAEANAMNQSLGRSTRIVFADPGFGPANAMLASQHWLFTWNPPGVPEDFVVAQRMAACPPPPNPPCLFASMGHPNPIGAQAYADAIFAAFKSANGLQSSKVIYVRNTPFPGNIPCYFQTGRENCSPLTFEGPHQYVTNAVNAAGCADIVNIRAGSYHESFTVNQAVRLKAYDGPVTIGR